MKRIDVGNIVWLFDFLLNKRKVIVRRFLKSDLSNCDDDLCLGCCDELLVIVMDIRRLIFIR